jgi:hypothetical protein
MTSEDLEVHEADRYVLFRSRTFGRVGVHIADDLAIFPAYRDPHGNAFVFGLEARGYVALGPARGGEVPEAGVRGCPTTRDAPIDTRVTPVRGRCLHARFCLHTRV